MAHWPVLCNPGTGRPFLLSHTVGKCQQPSSSCRLSTQPTLGHIGEEVEALICLPVSTSACERLSVAETHSRAGTHCPHLPPPATGAGHRTLAATSGSTVRLRHGMEMWCLVVLVLAMVNGGGNGTPIGNIDQRGLESTTAAAFNNYIREDNTSSDHNITVHAVITDKSVPQPLFLEPGKQNDWRERQDSQHRRKLSARQPVPRTEIDKLQNNITDFNRGDIVPACFGCVLCQLTNSCKK